MNAMASCSIYLQPRPYLYSTNCCNFGYRTERNLLLRVDCNKIDLINYRPMILFNGSIVIYNAIVWYAMRHHVSFRSISSNSDRPPAQSQCHHQKKIIQGSLMPISKITLSLFHYAKFVHGAWHVGFLLSKSDFLVNKFVEMEICFVIKDCLIL